MILVVLLLLGPIITTACGYTDGPRENQPAVTATGNPPERYATASLIQRPVSSSWYSSSQQSVPVGMASMFAQIPSVPPTVACWATPFCDSILSDFAYCYNMSGSITDPNADDGRGYTYQRCLCTNKGTMYNNITVMNYPRDAKDNLTQCYECMRQAGVDVDNVYGTSIQMRLITHKFCEIGSPDLYELLATFLTWLQATNEPVDHNTKLGGIVSITKLAHLFTSTSRIDEPAVVSSSPQSIETRSSESRFISSGAIPTEYLQQIPTNWPYTTYGAARKDSQTASFPLTDVNSASVTVAWLCHKILWNPRPLFTPSPARDGMYQPGLRDWVPAFLGMGALSITTDISTTSLSTETADPIVTPALHVEVALTSCTTIFVSATTISSLIVPASSTLPASTSMLISITPLTALSTTSNPASPLSTSRKPVLILPSYHSATSVPVRPPYHQESVMSQMSDTGHVTTTLSRRAHPGDENAGQDRRQGEAMEKLRGEMQRMREAIHHHAR